MAYDEGLAARVRELIGDEPALVEKKMFGGLAMLVFGNMAVGVHGEDLIVRCDPAEHDAFLAEPGARPFEMTARPMKGWLLVDPVDPADPAGQADERDLRRWIERGLAYARSLPPK